jgi:hypothetical protein
MDRSSIGSDGIPFARRNAATSNALFHSDAVASQREEEFENANGVAILIAVENLRG